MAVLTSYDAHGLAQNEPLAKTYQKHPRSWVRALKPRDYTKMQQSIAGSASQDPSSISLSASTIVHTAVVGTVVGNLSTTFYGTGTPPAMTYTLTSNPNSNFKIVGAALQVNSVLVAGTVPIVVQGAPTAEPALSVTASFNITVT